ncbi:hypothetical protein [Lysinibacillus sp. Bpr_S20]|uniref:hypothetical protein n=1 Tax=Lysinibacillus sp. Bpr_S20 TaxID=2933964 RepID=UPI002012BE4D|nr:hypothetical protein [Lysinibacillus sp. Bpr_S20]MCL1701915.1 hypothetical protein [Lysinibacillus sp. Bpr_S20]
MTNLVLAQAAHRTPPGSSALRESEASAAMFYLCESEASATNVFCSESKAAATNVFCSESKAAATKRLIVTEINSTLWNDPSITAIILC